MVPILSTYGSWEIARHHWFPSKELTVFRLEVDFLKLSRQIAYVRLKSHLKNLLLIGGWTRISYLNGNALKTKMYTIVHHNLDQTTAEEGKDFWLSQKSIQEYYNTYQFKQIRFVCEHNGNNDYPRMDFTTPLSRADDAINYFIKRDGNNQPITSARIKSCDIEVFELIVIVLFFAYHQWRMRWGKCWFYDLLY